MSHPPTPGNMRADGPMDMDAIGTGNRFSTAQNASCMNVSYPDAHEGPSTVKLSKIIACEIKVMYMHVFYCETVNKHSSLNE
jgi:hypothetical protein